MVFQLSCCLPIKVFVIIVLIQHILHFLGHRHTLSEIDSRNYLRENLRPFVRLIP